MLTISKFLFNASFSFQKLKSFYEYLRLKTDARSKTRIIEWLSIIKKFNIRKLFFLYYGTRKPFLLRWFLVSEAFCTTKFLTQIITLFLLELVINCYNHLLLMSLMIHFNWRKMYLTYLIKIFQIWAIEIVHLKLISFTFCLV